MQATRDDKVGKATADWMQARERLAKDADIDDLIGASLFPWAVRTAA
jgi:hypothetical protein